MLQILNYTRRLQINYTKTVHANIFFINCIYLYLKDKAYALQRSTLDHAWIKGAVRSFFPVWQKIFPLPDRFDWIRPWDICKQEKIHAGTLFCQPKDFKALSATQSLCRFIEQPIWENLRCRPFKLNTMFSCYKQMLVCGVRMDILLQAAVLLIRLWLQYSQRHNCIFVIGLLVRGSVSNSVASLPVSVQTSLKAPLIFRAIPNLEPQSHGRVSQHPSYRHETLWPSLSTKRFQGAGDI